VTNHSALIQGLGCFYVFTCGIEATLDRERSVFLLEENVKNTLNPELRHYILPLFGLYYASIGLYESK
jgi:hypothetical protein